MKEIKIRTSEEIASINADTLTLDAVQIDRIQAVRKAIKILEEEKKAWDMAILDKYNHAKVNTGTVRTVITDYFDFNKEEFIEKYGQEKYDELKTKPVHRETVYI